MGAIIGLVQQCKPMIRIPKDGRTGNKSMGIWKMPLSWLISSSIHHVNGFMFPCRKIYIFFLHIYPLHCQRVSCTPTCEPTCIVNFKIYIPASGQTVHCVKVCMAKLIYRNAFVENVQIFKYIGHKYFFGHSQFFFHKYIRTFVLVKFVCTNIFGY